jgi:hypothetical protein
LWKKLCLSSFSVGGGVRKLGLEVTGTGGGISAITGVGGACGGISANTGVEDISGVL